MIVITGGAGFIGFNVATELNLSGNEVIIVDYLYSNKQLGNTTKLKKFRRIDPEKLFSFINKNKNKIKAVIHLGAISSTSESNLSLLLKNNLYYSEKLFNITNKYGIKFIYASSASTYGDGQAGFSDKNTLMNFIKLKPINFYGLSKHLFDLKVLEQLSSKQIVDSFPIGLKFFNVYGPHEMHKGFMMSPIPKFYSEIKANGYLKLFKSHNPNYQNGMQSRDFIYVKDCVEIIKWFLKKRKKKGIYNVGTGKSETFLKLSSIIFQNVGVKENIKYINTPKKIREGYQYMTRADIKNLRSAGFTKKFTSLSSGVNDYINNYLI